MSSSNPSIRFPSPVATAKGWQYTVSDSRPFSKESKPLLSVMITMMAFVVIGLLFNNANFAGRSGSLLLFLFFSGFLLVLSFFFVYRSYQIWKEKENFDRVQTKKVSGIIERKLIRMLRREAGFPIFSYVQFLLLNRKESPFISPGNYIYLIKIGGERQMIKVNRQMFYLADTGEFVEADVFPVSRTTRKLVTHSQHQKNQMDREALSQKEWQVLIFSQNYYLIRWFFGIAMIICVIWLIVTVF